MQDKFKAKLVKMAETMDDEAIEKQNTKKHSNDNKGEERGEEGAEAGVPVDGGGESEEDGADSNEEETEGNNREDSEKTPTGPQLKPRSNSAPNKHLARACRTVPRQGLRWQGQA